MDERIEVGDLVTVTFSDGGEFRNAMVLSVPAATGESWIVRGDTGKILYIMLFETMALDYKGVKP